MLWPRCGEMETHVLQASREIPVECQTCCTQNKASKRETMRATEIPLEEKFIVEQEKKREEMKQTASMSNYHTQKHNHACKKNIHMRIADIICHRHTTIPSHTTVFQCRVRAKRTTCQNLSFSFDDLPPHSGFFAPVESPT